MAEVANRRGEMYGTDRLVRQLARQEGIPVNEVVRRMADGVNQWADNQHQQDDLSLIVFEFTGEPADRRSNEPILTSASIQLAIERMNP